MFTDAALAARIDAIEATLAAAFARAVEQSGVAVAIDALGGGVAALGRPGSPTNKIAGAGFGAAIDPDALAAIEARWWAVGEPVRFELSTIAPPAIHRMLSARGYRLDGFEHVLGRRIEASDAVMPPGAVTVERITAATLDLWIELALDGFTVPDGSDTADLVPREVLAPLFADFAAIDLPRYVARIDGEPAGSATACIDGGLLLLCGASTLPRFRRRGVQRALLAARLADAHAAGCDLAVVTTAPASQSQANVMRLGFDLLYARAVLLRAP